MPQPRSARRPLRICVCVVFNHPFPKILPLLREIYEGRFSKLLFFMPFERLPDEDVITVYHGCYSSPGYITESRHILEQIDCDAFMFIHDDVLLNPLLSEANFRDYFPLGPEDGFIPAAESPPESLGDWSWYFGSLPKMFFPKSVLFGGGIEYENVYKYLPDPQALVQKLQALGIHHKTFVNIDPEAMPDIEHQPSRALFHGMSRSHADGSGVRIADGTPLQDKAEELSLEAARALIRAMVATLRADDPEQMRGNYIDLPYPLISTGYMSDFYILPKAKLADFAHYAGVFTAANIWHETMVATILFAICRNVYLARDLGLDFSGFTDRPGLEAFADPDYMAIHPVKLSKYLAPEVAGSFLARIAAIRDGRDYSTRSARMGVIAFSYTAQEEFAGEGWHGPEEWGRWARETMAEIRFDLPDDMAFHAVRLRLRAPVHPLRPEFHGAVAVNGGSPTAIRADLAGFEQEVELPASAFVPGANLIALTSEHVLVPREVDPASPDDRQLGFGLRSIEFV